MKRMSLALLTLVLTAAGCQDRQFLNTGVGPNGNETGMPAVSIDEFAQQQGISRQESRDYFLKAQEELAAAAPAK